MLKPIYGDELYHVCGNITKKEVKPKVEKSPEQKSDNNTPTDKVKKKPGIRIKDVNPKHTNKGKDSISKILVK